MRNLRGCFFVLFAVLATACSSNGSTDGGRDGAMDARSDAADGSDARIDIGPEVCTNDNDCADGVFCNGAERCAPGMPGANALGCIAASPATPCSTGQMCDEPSLRCIGCATDADHDGHRSVSCGGDDCDDSDPTRFPGNPEMCDATGHDEDCDACTVAGATDGDADADGFVSTGCFNRYAGPTPSCDPAMVHVNGSMLSVAGIDCDDTDGNVRPNQTETCNGADDNCNGTTDEGVRSSFYPDCDGDGFGDAMAMPGLACMATDLTACNGHAVVTNNTDCNDRQAAIHPGVLEQCDTAMVDDNCDGATNEGCSCVDGSTVPCGSMLPGCTAGVQTCSGGMLGACSVTVTLIACYADGDGDGFAPAGAAMSMACACPSGTTVRAPVDASTTDCDDSRNDVSPARSEVCDAARVDENCSGAANEGCMCVNGTTMACGSSLPGCSMGVRTCVMGAFGTCSVTNAIVTCYTDADMDLYAPTGAATSMACVCPGGTTNRAPSGATNIDCNDSRNNMHPGATEVCDGLDNNCNGTIDDGLRVNCYTDADNDTFPATGATVTAQCPDSSRTRFGNCPAGFTNIAPTTATSDCDDGQALTPHCGAPMHCTPERVCGCEASLWYNADYLDLETGAVARGAPGSGSDVWDNNGTGGIQYLAFRTGVSWRHIDPATFVSIDSSYAVGLMTGAVDSMPFVSTAVIVVRTGSGNLFKLGNPSLVTYMGSPSIHFTYAPISPAPAGFACMM